MIVLLSALAMAHHPDASARLGSGVAGGPAVVAPETGVGVDVSLSTGLSRYARIQQGFKTTGDDAPVLTWNNELGVRVWFPSGVFASASLPVSTVSASGETWTAVGDVGASIGVAHTFGHTDTWVDAGLTAPTGGDGSRGTVSILDVQTSDGTLDIRSKDIRTQPGLGTWGMGVNAGLAARRGDWSFRSELGVRTPLGRTADDVRWGWDVQGAVGVMRRLARVDVGLFTDAWTHTADRHYTDDEVAFTANLRHGLGLRPVVSVAPTEALRIGAQVQVPLVQWVDGTQLVQGLSGGASATVRL